MACAAQMFMETQYLQGSTELCFEGCKNKALCLFLMPTAVSGLQFSCWMLFLAILSLQLSYLRLPERRWGLPARELDSYFMKESDDKKMPSSLHRGGKRFMCPDENVTSLHSLYVSAS